jgi:hypothetical protein
MEEVSPMKDLFSDEAIEESRKRYLETQRSYAMSMRYVPRRDAFVFVMRAGATISIPRIAIKDLRDVPSSDIENVVLDEDGGSIRYAPLDIDISVPGLVRNATGAADWLKRATGSKTPAKATSSRLNGRKGGRPRKDRATVAA